MTTAVKPNLVILPGLLTDEVLFEHELEQLTDIAHCIVAGYGAAENIREMATEVLAQAPVQFVLLGFSMGGYVALEIMRRAPERVLALILMSTSARADTPAAIANRLQRIAQAEANFQTVLDEMMPSFLHPSRMQFHSNVTTVYSMGHRVGKDTFIRHERAIMGRIDSRDSLKEIHCPTLVVCGADDVLTPVDVHEELCAGISGAHLKIIPLAAHFLPIGVPEIVSALLRKWLLKLPTTLANNASRKALQLKPGTDAFDVSHARSASPH